MMIEREIMLLKSLHHPNILGLVESYKAIHMGKLHTILALPYMDNDLAKLMRLPRYSPTLPQKRSYMKQLLEGVRCLHSSKVFHRDLKPANILVNDRGILRITDLGLARLYEGAVRTCIEDEKVSSGTMRIIPGN
jgi:serine/threonine protein kinase